MSIKTVLFLKKRPNLLRSFLITATFLFVFAHHFTRAGVMLLLFDRTKIVFMVLKKKEEKCLL